MSEEIDVNSKKTFSTTNKVDTEAQIQRLEALGRFAGIIAHEFNNILSVIEGYTYSAMRKMENGELTKEHFEKVLKATDSGADLTRQLLSFGKMKIDVEEKINLAEALKEVHTLLRSALGNNIHLVMSIPDYPIWIEMSRDQISQILMNLTLNARDAMPNGGDLSIVFTSCKDEHVPEFLKKRSSDAEFVRLNVTDTGAGMSQEVFNKAFDPYFTTKDKVNGVGLGLSVVYGILNQLGGGVEVSSKEGYGSCFSIYIPVSAPPEGSSVLATDLSGIAAGDDKTKVRINTLDKSEELKDKTIMIAEDEPELRALLASMFEDMDMNVLSAESGIDAMSLQNEYDNEIDFLLTDVVMPEMDGVELGEKFHEARPDSEVIYMSGYPFIERKKKNIEVPKDAELVSKPVREDNMKNILKRAMQRKKERMGEE